MSVEVDRYRRYLEKGGRPDPAWVDMLLEEEYGWGRRSEYQWLVRHRQSILHPTPRQQEVGLGRAGRVSMDTQDRVQFRSCVERLVQLVKN